MQQQRFATRVTRTCLVLMLALCGLGACQAGKDADVNAVPKTGAAAYYDGENITWIIPYSPGGGYDEYARLLAPYLEKYTGARLDILNSPGAGGLRGVNELAHSPSNGLTIGMINGSALVMNELAGIKGADYKISDFEFLGRIVADKRVLVISRSSGYETFEDMRKDADKIKIGATGLGGSTYVDAVISNAAFDMNMEIIHGFDNSSTVKQAMLRGDIVGTWGSWGSAVDAVSADREKVVLQSGTERSADLPDVPTAYELVGTTANPERTKAILAAWESLQAVGRLMAAPPGTPPERVAFLTGAMDKALHDPDLLQKAAKGGRTFDYATPEELEQVVDNAENMPDDIETLFVNAIRGQL